jgi:3-oxoacyl-[acyl-carrier-protein] synthase II
MRRAVITGVGVVSAFGVESSSFFDGLAGGRGAIGPIRSFDARTFSTRIAGEVPPVEPHLARERLSSLANGGALFDALAESGALRDRKVLFGLLAAEEAWRQARCGPEEQAAALSVALGLEQSFLEDFGALFDEGRILWERERAAPLPPVRLRSRVDLAAEALQKLFGLKGGTTVHASACAAGGLALTHAAALIERGEAPVVLCGATDSMVNPLSMGGMSRLGALSPRNEPDACRPFDRRRDGLVMGEGAAMFVLESGERARRRGVRPLARILSWGCTQDAYRVTMPRPDGAAARRAMERALRQAHLPPEAVGYINAHGTGIPLNDSAETRAIQGALGTHAERVAVSSIKGAVGHLMAASGAVQLAACLLAFERDLLPGTANHQERDPECDLDIIGPEPRPARVDVVLSNCFGLGGQNVSVAFGRVE